MPPEKKDSKDQSLESAPAAPLASKRGKSGNGKQISAFVQECLKTLAPLLQVNKGGLEGNVGTPQAEATTPMGKPLETTSAQIKRGAVAPGIESGGPQRQGVLC